MDVSLPECVTTTPLPLVSLVGLEPTSPLWAQFVLAARGSERAALRFVAGDALKWPPAKPARISYEWFIPKGILKTNWLTKHLYELPAVLVIFMELEWNDPNFNEKKMECASRVQTVRSTLAGRGTKLAVVLIQCEPPMPSVGDDVTASERANGLCVACEISIRSLFVLPIKAENMSGYIIRLENAFYDLAQNYYHQEIRNVKAHRDYLNKTTHLYLFVRHQFKAGFLNELKRDYHSAYKHYCQAYSLLMEVRATDTNIMEVKTVAGFISYKICKLAFKLNLPRDAISQFRKHDTIFQQKVGMDALAFEHRGWQAMQCQVFADVFAEAIANGLPAIQTQHPGLYYQKAAEYAIARRELTEEISADLESYPHPDPLENLSKMEFFGQRPWRPGKVSLEPPDMERESTGIKALQLLERTKVDHSKLITNLLQKAIAQMRLFKSPRSESNLTVLMAEELKSTGHAADALSLLLPVADHYRREKWRLLLDSVLCLALRCAHATADVAEYVRLALELASEESSQSHQEKARMARNVFGMLEGKAPSAEPGTTSKDELAQSDNVARMWHDALAKKDDAAAIRIDISGLSSCIAFKAVFSSDSCKADQSVPLDVYVNNGTDLPLPVSEVAAVTTSERSHNLAWTGLDVIEPFKSYKKSFTVMPEQHDVGRKIVVRKVSARIGAPTGFQMLITSKVPESLVDEGLQDFILIPSASLLKSREAQPGDEISAEAEGEFHSVAMRSQIEVEQRVPRMKMTVRSQEPVLIGEWFPIKIELENLEVDSAEEVEFSARLEDAHDPLLADTTRMTFDPQSLNDVATTPTAHAGSLAAEDVTAKAGDLSAQARLSKILFMRTSTAGVRSVTVEASYSVHKCRSWLRETLRLESQEPFSVDSSLLSLRQKPIAQAHTDETFLLMVRLHAPTSHPLRIVDTGLELRQPVQMTRETVASSLAGCVMFKNSKGRECYPLVVKRSSLISPLDVHDFSLGKFVVKWKRDSSVADAEVIATTVTLFDLSSVRVALSSLFASARLPAFGVVRTPMMYIVKLSNQTDKVQEYALSTDPSEAFMMSGHKQLHFKIPPESDYTLTYVLYPLLAGDAVALPTLRLNGTRPAQTHDANESLDRLLPKVIAVLPKGKVVEDRKQQEVTSGFFKVLPGSFVKLEPPLFGTKIKSSLKNS